MRVFLLSLVLSFSAIIAIGLFVDAISPPVFTELHDGCVVQVERPNFGPARELGRVCP